MAEPQAVYVTNGNSSGFGPLGILFVPPLVAPGYLVYMTCLKLDAAGVHPMFIVASAIVEIAAVVYGLIAFYRHAPSMLAAIASALYLAATYGGATWFVGHDPIWTLGIAAAMGAIGFFVGRALSVEGRSSQALRTYRRAGAA